MPIFEYQCTACSAVTEILQLAGDNTKPQCGKCGSTKLTKMFSRAAQRTGSLRDGCASADSCGMGNSCAMQGGGSSPCCGGACNH